VANDYYTSSAALTDHTSARAAPINAEFDAVERAFDQLPDPDVLKEGRAGWGIDTGAANAYVVTLDATPTDYTEGLTLRFKPGASNTDVSSLNLNSLGVKSILRANGDVLQAGDIVGGMALQLTYVGGSFRISGAAGPNSSSHTHSESDVVGLVADLGSLVAADAALAAGVAEKAAITSLADVAFSGAYSDLIGEPTGVEDGATADQTDAEIETAYNNRVGVVDQATAEAGTDNNVARWTAQRVGQAIAALAPGGGLSGASIAASSITANTYTIDADDKYVGDDGTTLTIKINVVLNATAANAVAITLAKSSTITPANSLFVFFVHPDQVGAVTLVPETGATLNGGSGAVTVASAGSWVSVYVVSNSGSDARMVTVGDTDSSRTIKGVTTFSSNFLVPSATPAAAGNAQGNATAITAMVNGVSAADGTKGVILPTAAAGMAIDIVNRVAGSVLKVYPATGAAINALAANAAFSVAGGALGRFGATSSTQWYVAPHA
jgi:hypothetical protein